MFFGRHPDRKGRTSSPRASSPLAALYMNFVRNHVFRAPPRPEGGVPATGVHFLLTFYYCVSGGSWFFGCHPHNPCPRVPAPESVLQGIIPIVILLQFGRKLVFLAHCSVGEVNSFLLPRQQSGVSTCSYGVAYFLARGRKQEHCK